MEKGTVQHMRFSKKDGSYKLGQHEFRTIEELIKHCKKNHNLKVTDHGSYAKCLNKCVVAC